MAARQELQQVAKKLAKQVQNTWRHNKPSAEFFKDQMATLTDTLSDDHWQGSRKLELVVMLTGLSSYNDILDNPGE